MSKEKTMPCAGQCQQGRKPCQTPQACEMPEDDPPRQRATTIISTIVIVTAIIIIALSLG